MTGFVFGGGAFDLVFVPPRADGGSLSGRIGLAYTIYLDADATVLCPITDLSGDVITDSVVRTTADSLFGAFLTVDETLTVVYGKTPGGEIVALHADIPGRLAELQRKALRRDANLADLDTPAEARAHLGLGSAATHASTDFDPTGAASMAQAAAQAASIPLVQKGAANGVATLDAGGKLPSAELPPLAINDTFPVVSQAAMLALTAQRGDVAVRTDLVPAETFMLVGDDPAVLADWVQITTPGAVTTVDGQTGVVDLSGVYARVPSVDGSSGDLLIRDPDAANGATSWRTASDAVGRTLGWVIATDPQYAGGMKIDGTTNDTAALQAAVNAVGDGGTVLVPGTGIALINSVTIDGKRNVKISCPGVTLKRVAAPTAPMFKIGWTTRVTNLTVDVKEVDGNNFAGGQSTGEAFNCHGADGITINAYVHHTWDHAIRFSTADSYDVDITLRADHIGAGYNLDPTFNANNPPMGCGVYASTSCTVNRAVIRVDLSDVKGGGGLYIAKAADLLIDKPRITRTGYRGIKLGAGSPTIQRCIINQPQVSYTGILYEINPTTVGTGGRNPWNPLLADDDPAQGHRRYGEGTNGIYTKDAPVTPQDCIVYGGAIHHTAEPMFEGRGLLFNVVCWDGAQSYTGFGPDLAKKGIYLNPGSEAALGTGSGAFGCRIFRPGDYGVHSSDPGVNTTKDIAVENCYVEDAAVAGIAVDILTAGATMTGVVLANNRVVTKDVTLTPTHGVRIKTSSSSASIDATCLLYGNRVLGTYSVNKAVIEKLSFSGGSTNLGQAWDNVVAPAPPAVPAPANELYVERLTDSSPVNNSATVINDATLSVAVEANSLYVVTGMLIYRTTTVADFKFGWDGPLGSTLEWTPGSLTSAQSDTGGTTGQQNSAHYSIGNRAAAGGPRNAGDTDAVARPYGRLRTGGTAGLLNFMWAQNTAEASDTSIRAGSFVRLTKLA